METNIRQRGNIDGSQLKLGRRIREMERIYGIREGSANPKRTEIGTSQTNGLSQGDLAQKLGISYKTLQRAKSLPTLPVEIQELVEQGKISPSTASRLIARLTSEQQEYINNIN